jgi:hypothetical protein
MKVTIDLAKLLTADQRAALVEAASLADDLSRAVVDARQQIEHARSLGRRGADLLRRLREAGILGE